MLVKYVFNFKNDIQSQVFVGAVKVSPVEVAVEAAKRFQQRRKLNLSLEIKCSLCY